MSVVVLDSNAIIMHGRAFPERVHTAVEAGTKLVLPRSVKQELVDDVLDADNAPQNHRNAAQAIQELIDEGYLVLRQPKYEAYTKDREKAHLFTGGMNPVSYLFLSPVPFDTVGTGGAEP